MCLNLSPKTFFRKIKSSFSFLTSLFLNSFINALRKKYQIIASCLYKRSAHNGRICISILSFLEFHLDGRYKHLPQVPSNKRFFFIQIIYKSRKFKVPLWSILATPLVKRKVKPESSEKSMNNYQASHYYDCRKIVPHIHTNSAPHTSTIYGPLFHLPLLIRKLWWVFKLNTNEPKFPSRQNTRIALSRGNEIKLAAT